MECEKFEIDIVITPEGEGRDKIYSISSIQFPNVVTQGNTIEQAKSRLKEALELYFEEVPKEKEILIRIEKEDNMPMISRMLL
jgi:predicted RNase H-like HicB family nuclease